jgi:hypothetical protein
MNEEVEYIKYNLNGERTTSGPDRIRLIREDGPHGLWVAAINENPTDVEGISIGAYIHPTPFLAVTPYWVVVDDIRRVKPDAIITQSDFRDEDIADEVDDGR